MNVNFKGLKAKKLSGEEYSHNLAQVMGDIIYGQTSSLKFLKTAQAIFDEKDVDLTEAEISFFISLISEEDCHYIVAVKVALIEFLKEQLEYFAVKKELEEEKTK